jgi:hypothetical protein
LSVVFILAIVFSVCVTLLFFGGMNMIQEHPAVKPVVERLNTDPRVEAQLGKPLEIAKFLGEDAKVNVGRKDGFARYTLPVKGPKGEGVVIVHTVMKDQEWDFQEISLQMKGQAQLLDLLMIPEK